MIGRKCNSFCHFISFIQLFVVCIAIGICINYTFWSFLPLVCNVRFLSANVKRDVFKCPLTERALRIRNPSNLVAYFDNPFEGSIQNEEKLDELIVRSQNEPHLTCKDAEAIAALQAAKRLRNDGNIKKAQSIVMHAYSLAPHHPDILTEYGIFLETANNNIIEAEGYYLRALTRDPEHTEALIRRAKALPLVEEIDNQMLKEIYRKRDLFLKIPRNDPGLKRAMRESYFQHIYHTVALEGNTMSLIQTRVILETRMAIAGKSIIEHNEILGMDAALRFLNQTLGHIGDLTIDHILAIHKRVLGFVDPLEAGVIRQTQVYVGSFTPPAPELVTSEMQELVNWLNDEETLALDPVELSALAHYKLVYIHPFIDGNGRTSRLLMNFILMQAGFPPVIIDVEDRLRYYTVLQRANEGDLRPFIRFISEKTDRTLKYFIESATPMCDINECNNDRYMHVNGNNDDLNDGPRLPVIVVP